MTDSVPIFPIFSTELYDVIVADSPMPEHKAAGIQCYGIRNRKYGVVEMHVGTLPQAMQDAVDLTRALKRGPISEEQAMEKVRDLLGLGAPMENLAAPKKPKAN